MTDAATIARALRGHRTGDAWLCRCPLPSHGKGTGDRNPSLLVKDGAEAVLFKCFAGCAAQDILHELRGRGIVGEYETHDHAVKADPVPEHKPNPEALDLWRQAGPILPDSVQAKFLASRGLTIKLPPSLRGATLMHLDRYPLPAMIAAVQAPARQIIAVQVTLIDPRGDRKAQVRIPRKTMGALGWGAVRLAAAGEELGLAEGTEKALAAMQLFNVPVWSSLGAGRMHRVHVPDRVSELHIFVDNDAAGRAAAERTAHEHRHRRVVLRFPPQEFKDWDDLTKWSAAG